MSSSKESQNPFVTLNLAASSSQALAAIFVIYDH